MLTTEQSNPDTFNLHEMSAFDIVRKMNAEDATISNSVQKALPEIASAVELITDRLKKGGRLFYIGAGNSGRLGVMDASECPPTFGTKPDMVHGIISGGEFALGDALELAEDDRNAGKEAIQNKNINKLDAVFGISASGTTPFVLAALEYARAQGTGTIGLACNEHSPLLERVDIGICVLVGPEILAGSTRLKAGTAQKMVLNMLSTTTMIRLGKVYKNRMVDLQVTNKKLVRRAEQMVAELGEVSLQTASKLLTQTGNNVKKAIVMARLGISSEEAEKRILDSRGYLEKIL